MVVPSSVSRVFWYVCRARGWPRFSCLCGLSPCVPFPSLTFGFLYPAYASYKAIKSKSRMRMMPWLMYWAVAGFLSSLEFVSDSFLFWYAEGQRTPCPCLHPGVILDRRLSRSPW
jgi:hypothetical protein